MLRKFALPSLLLVLCIVLAAGATTKLFQAALDGRATRRVMVDGSAAGDPRLHRTATNYRPVNQLASISPINQARYQYHSIDWARAAQSYGFTAYHPTVRASAEYRDPLNPRALNRTPNAMQRSWSTIKSMFR